ncbi:phage antirepressor KilAC domain-containing protein [Scrofimicrobium sp. R131]|uniref:Phage antirepressor KilAC domain-containing protein n=1 Tax=Scrofimicrobium appendicitidis TaxID=3079930 RepID=A0AAU7VA66_9ACTO
MLRRPIGRGLIETQFLSFLLNLPTPRQRSAYAQEGHTQLKAHEYGEGRTRTHMYWTQKGTLFIYDLPKSRDELPAIEQGNQT